jgi:hypothetical protein
VGRPVRMARWDNIDSGDNIDKGDNIDDNGTFNRIIKKMLKVNRNLTLKAQIPSRILSLT